MGENIDSNPFCEIHQEEMGKDIPAIDIDPKFGAVCQECHDNLAKDRINDIINQGKYDYACGYKN